MSPGFSSMENPVHRDRVSTFVQKHAALISGIIDSLDIVLAPQIKFYFGSHCFDSIKVLPLRYSLEQFNYDSTHASVACIYEISLIGFLESLNNKTDREGQDSFEF